MIPTPHASSTAQTTRRMNGVRFDNHDGSILITVTPTPGHVSPMLAIACHLRDQGHSIIFNTADVFQKR